MNNWIENVQLGSALLKGSGLLLAASLLVLLLRKASATSQFRVCFVGISMSLLVAVASMAATLFKLDVPIGSEQVVPVQHAVAVPSGFIADQPTRGLVSPPSVAPHATLAQSSDVFSSKTPISKDSPPSSILKESTDHAANNPVVDSNTFYQRGISSLMLNLSWWPYVWGTVAAAILLQSLLQHLLAFRVLDRCKKSEDETVLRLASGIAQRLEIAMPELVVCEQSITPLVAGLWKPKIVLPVDLGEWPVQKMTFVLLHEMSHIKRRDLWTQFIAKAAVAVYWFNPLSWWSFAQLMRLRELACDDCVLLQEEKPGSYAETLLDVASRYRSQGPAYGIGMSGKLDIKRRIHCALDATAARTSFSKRTLRWLAGLSLVLCLVLGVIQPWVRAVEPESKTPPASAEKTEQSTPKAEPKVEAAIDEEARSMLIKVVDEQLQPLAGVDVYITGIDYDRPSQLGNLPRIHYPTNSSGEAVIKFRKGKLLIQYWISKPSYVPQALRFDEQKSGLPNEYTFYFEKGERLSGKVVDTAGNPIAGARVQVKTDGAVKLNEHARASVPRAGCSGWLAEDEEAVRTNAEGVWEIHNAPSVARNPDLNFELIVDHPDFAGDKNWGDYQRKQGIKSAQLRDGTATLVMDRGAIIRGKITGPNGEPVTKGLVIWVSNPYFATGDNESQIRPDGTYQLPNLEPGKYPITVLAPGYAPDQREVDLKPDSPACDFQLERGNSIRIEIVDTNGNPIPNATVALARDGWRGNTAMYNDHHPNVPDTGIPRRSDDKGVYAWDWAPSDGVKYEIYKSGYDNKAVTLVAKPEAHRVVLTSPMKITGNVVDQSGKPIEHFKVMPVKVFRPDFYSTDFQEGNVVAGKDGKFEMELHSQGGASDRFRVRVEADGYRTAFGTRSVASGDSLMVEDFQLENVPALVGHVLSQTGNPVNKFLVAIGTATTSPRFSSDGPDTNFGQVLFVDGSSEFKIAASFEPQRLRVFNDDGFAEFVVQVDQREIGEVVLKPYASISGRLMQGDVPIGNEAISFFPLVQRGLTEARFQDSFSTLTDPNGYFDLKRLPPTAGSIRTYLNPWRDSRLTSSQSLSFDLHSGDYKQVILSGNGASVVGHVVATGRSDDKFSKQWSLNWLVSRKDGIPLPPDAAPLNIPSNSGAIETAWLKYTDFQYWLATKENHYVKLSEDGSFKIHGVAEGEYDLVIQLYDQPAGCLVEAVGTRVIPVTVTADEISKKEMNLGALEVECRSGPRPGSDMRAYEFVDSEGRVVYVNDLAGRYLLLHVWASWCAPCLATMPQLKVDIDEMKQARLTAIGINIDADKKAGQAIAEKFGLSWSQNYVGEDSNLARQLAVSSVPAYYLIGPDGKLVGSSSEWKEIHKLLPK